jgi:hypothetical protein
MAEGKNNNKISSRYSAITIRLELKLLQQQQQLSPGVGKNSLKFLGHGVYFQYVRVGMGIRVRV